MTSLRVKLTVLVAVPLVLLVVVAALGVRHANDVLQAADDADDHLQVALAATDATLALVQERRLTVAAPESDGLSGQREQTDEALRTLSDLLDRQGDAASVDDSRSEEATGAIADLPAVRADIDDMTSVEDVLAASAAVLGPVLALDAFDPPSEPGIADRHQTLRAVVRLADHVALEESLLQTAFDQENLTPSVDVQLSSVVAGEDLWADRFRETAGPAEVESYDQLSSSQSATEATRFRDDVLATGPAEQASADDVVWATATDRKIEQLMTLASESAAGLDQALGETLGELQQDRRNAYGLLLAALGLLVLALYALQRFAVRPIEHLATSSAAAADDLDSAVKTGDSHAIVPLEPPGDAELYDVAEAFAAAQDAVASLVDERGKARDETSEVFLNFGRRAQNLVTRQLGQIDDLEARTDDPDVLADLFLLDHLATRLRRTAESLVLLAGSESPRPWARPVSVVNVIRAAAAETSDYSRADLAQVGPGAVTGAIANDVSHLLAELVDNALTYSPPESRVSISGERQADGRYVISVTDAGLGMSSDQLAEANARLRGIRGACGLPDDPDSADVPLSKHFGLYVAGRLAARHSIDVRLVPSSLNGITAAVGLPRTVMVLPTDGQAPAVPAGPSRQEIPTPLATPPAPVPPGAPTTGPVPVTGRAEVRRRTVHPTSAIAMPAAGTQDD